MRIRFKLFFLLWMAISCQAQQDIKPVELLCYEQNYKFFDNVERRSCYVSILSILNEGVTVNPIKGHYWNRDQNRFIEYTYDCNSAFGLIAENKYIFYMPLGLYPCFSNLSALAVTNSKLKKISLVDLIFSRLELLDLSGNEIEVMESNLFIGIRNLKYLKLNYNRIAMVESNGLSGLSDLVFFELLYNICYSSGYRVSQNSQNIRTFINNVKDLCSLERKQNDIINNQTCSYKCELKNQTDMITNIATFIEDIKGNFTSLISDISELKANVSFLMNKNFSSSDASEQLMASNDEIIAAINMTNYILITSHIILMITMISMCCCCQKQSNASKPKIPTETLKMQQLSLNRTHQNPSEMNYEYMMSQQIEKYDESPIETKADEALDGIYEPLSNNNDLYMECNSRENNSLQNDAENSNIYSEVHK